MLIRFCDGVRGRVSDRDALRERLILALIAEARAQQRLFRVRRDWRRRIEDWVGDDLGLWLDSHGQFCMPIHPFQLRHVPPDEEGTPCLAGQIDMSGLWAREWNGNMA